MPKHQPAPEPKSRYSIDLVRIEINALLARCRRGTRSRLARHLNLRPQQLTKRLNGETDLTLAYIGAIADWFGAPPGWPFESYHVLETAFGRHPPRQG